MANGQPDRLSFDYRVAARRLGAKWKELILASMIVALIVTPPDVVAMLYAVPPILLAISIAYVVGAFMADKEREV